MNDLALKFHPDTLVNRARAFSAMYAHYGWDFETKQPLNKNVVPRDLPNFKSKTPNVNEKNFYQGAFIAGNADVTQDISTKYFNIAQAGKVSARTNMSSSQLADSKCFLIMGFRIRQALNSGTQLVTDPDTSLDYGSITSNELENARISIEVNKVKIVEDEKISQLFKNGDAMGDFFRLPTTVVLEPATSMLVEIISNGVVAKWVEVAACGYLFED